MEEINNNNANATHVAVLVFPFSSHPTILLAMVCHLATSSPNTLFSFFGTAESNKSIFSSSSIPNNVKPYDVWDGVPDDYVFSGRHHEDIDLFMNSTTTSFKNEIDVTVAHTGRQVNVVVTDAFLWFGAQIAVELGGVPWVACWTSGSIALASYIYIDPIRENFGRKDGNNSESDDLITYVPGMFKIRISDLPLGIVSSDLGSVFHGMLHKTGQILPDKAP